MSQNTEVTDREYIQTWEQVEDATANLKDLLESTNWVEIKNQSRRLADLIEKAQSTHFRVTIPLT
jgi:hypothetical protein